MTLTLDQLRIFISYPRGGAAHTWAEAVHASLTDLGARVFRDEISVQEGDQNWSRTIETSLLSADLVVAIVGTDSEICRWQARELLGADRLGLPVVRWLLATPERTADDPERARVVHGELGAIFEVVSRLPDAQRVCFWMRHVDGMSQPEIAEALGFGKSYVCKLLQRADDAVARARAESDTHRETDPDRERDHG